MAEYLVVGVNMAFVDIAGIARVNFLYARSSAIFVAKDCRPLQ